MPDAEKRTQRSYFFPILLIIIGALFLAHNLDVIPGRGWRMVVNLWPALLIVAGLDDVIRRQGVAWPMLLMAAGTLLLINNFSPRPFLTWTKAIQLWPLILIAFGIDLLFRTRTWWTTVITVLLVILMVGGAVWWVALGGSGPTGNTYPIQQLLSSSVEGADVVYQLGAGQLIVGKTEEDGFLAAGSAFPAEPVSKVEVEEGRVTYTLKSENPVVSPRTSQWELGLSPDVPLRIEVDNGAGEVFMALEALQLEGLQIDQGVGDVVVRLPDGTRGRVQIEQAVGRIRIVVPPDLALEVTTERALSTLDLPRDYERVGDVYRSSGEEESGQRVEIHIEQAVGLISISETR